MNLQIRRVMLFARDMATMAQFYEQRLGLKVLERSPGFVDFDAGACRIALHRTGIPRPGRTKICFFTEDVTAVRAELIKRGVTWVRRRAPEQDFSFATQKILKEMFFISRIGHESSSRGKMNRREAGQWRALTASTKT